MAKVIGRGRTATETYPEARSSGDEGPTGPAGDEGPTGPEGPEGPLSGAAGGDLSGTYPNPNVIGFHPGVGLPHTYGLVENFGLLGTLGGDVGTKLVIKSFFQVPIAGGVAVGFPVTEIAVNVAAEFPGIQVGNAVIPMGGDLQQWQTDGETGRPTILYCYVSAPEVITFGMVNAAAAATSAGNLITIVGWLKF